MKKTILFLALIASIFVACEQQPEGVVKEDFYGIWVCENAGNESYDSDVEREHLLFIINEENTKFVSDDSIAISHGYWRYIEGSDLGYITYKYELVKKEKLILTRYNINSKSDSTLEFTYRPDLLPVVEYYIYEDKRHDLVTTNTPVKGFVGKWEWIATENLDSSKVAFTKHVMDTMENTIWEFKPNNMLASYHNNLINNGEKYSILSMPPYVITITKKDKGVISDRVKPAFSTSAEVLFWFPVENKTYYLGFSGSYYFYDSHRIEKGELILKDIYSDTRITFRKVE